MVSTTSSTSGSTASSAEELVRNSADDSVPWIIQKYGGTSVGKSLESVTKIVESVAFSLILLSPLTSNPRSYIPNSRVALVCSARSSHTKALGTTNLLLQASREALQPTCARSETPAKETPFYPKRVGSGFFGRERESSVGGRERDMSASMMSSSLSSLSQLDIRSGPPSPFQPSGASRSPPSPATPAVNGVSETASFHGTVDLIKKGHIQAARSAVRPGPMREELEDEIERDCETLRGFLYAAQVSKLKRTSSLADLNLDHRRDIT